MENLIDYLPSFIEAFKTQLTDDYKRWGDTWKTRPREGQELRVKARYDDYFDQSEFADVPVPWLKIMGEAFICWVREQREKNSVK